MVGKVQKIVEHSKMEKPEPFKPIGVVELSEAIIKEGCELRRRVRLSAQVRYR